MHAYENIFKEFKTKSDTKKNGNAQVEMQLLNNIIFHIKNKMFQMPE